MMTWKKRVLSGVMALSLVSVMAMQYTSNVLALENAESDYLEEVMPEYLVGTTYANMDGVRLSAGINYYDFSTMQVCRTVYIAYCEDTVIGMLSVEQENGERYSTFNQCSFPAIQEAYNAGKSVALGCYDDCIVLYDGEAFYNVMTSPIETVDVDATDVDIPLSSLEYTYDGFEPYIIMTRDSISTNLRFDLETVPTDKMASGIKDTCWAAAVATKYKHDYSYVRNPDGTYDENEINITSSNVYYRVRKVTGLSAPTGTADNIKVALEAYGLPSTYKTGGLSATKIYAEIYNDNPVIITVANVTDRHRLVIGGVSYFEFGNANYYVYDSDVAATSNVESVLIAKVKSNAASDWTDFEYIRPTDTKKVYTSWTETFGYIYE